MRSSSVSAELDPSFQLPIDSREQECSEWKQEANRRLAIHRARRSGRAALQTALPGMEEETDRKEESLRPKGKSVADRVAARYAKAPTYSEMLANEARNVARAAEAAAVAAVEARDAAQAILVGLDIAPDIGTQRDQASVEAGEETPQPSHSRGYERHNQAMSHGPSFASARPNEKSFPPAHKTALITEANDDDFQNEDEESISPIQPLPAKLLEFPRELVATRKARPRLAEGPLREDYDRDDARSQLRIFEVETEAISTQPAIEPVLPEWSPIRLDPHPAVPLQDWTRPHAQEAVSAASAARAIATGLELPLQTATLEDRLMAGVVDAALITGGFLVFILVFAACTVHLPEGKPAIIGAVAAFLAFAAIYLLLFFNFGTDTPGMRYAKIALCTFDDENPTRQATRRRLGALLLAVVPMGLGILWAFFDDDRLGWHDRISRTYQRSYH